LGAPSAPDGEIGKPDRLQETPSKEHGTWQGARSRGRNEKKSVVSDETNNARKSMSKLRLARLKLAKKSWNGDGPKKT
jgi:hypothetical protein